MTSFIYEGWEVEYQKIDENTIKINANEQCHITYADYDNYTFKRNDKGRWELYRSRGCQYDREVAPEKMISVSKFPSHVPPLKSEEWGGGTVGFPLKLLQKAEEIDYCEAKSVEFGEYLKKIDPGYISHSFSYEEGIEIIIDTTNKDDLSSHIISFFNGRIDDTFFSENQQAHIIILSQKRE